MRDQPAVAYTLIGSVLMLLAIIGIYYNSHAAPLAAGAASVF